MSLHLVAPAILARALNRSRMAGSPDCVCSFSEKLPTSRVCLGRSASCKMAGESSFQLRGDILAKWKIKQWHEETGGTRRGRTPPCTVSSKSLFTVLLYRVLLVARGHAKGPSAGNECGYRNARISESNNQHRPSRTPRGAWKLAEIYLHTSITGNAALWGPGRSPTVHCDSRF